jgi:hypothetical protein
MCLFGLVLCIHGLCSFQNVQTSRMLILKELLLLIGILFHVHCSCVHRICIYYCKCTWKYAWSELHMCVNQLHNKLTLLGQWICSQILKHTVCQHVLYLYIYFYG